MPPRELDTLMWAKAYEAMERGHRLQRQFFHRRSGGPCWEAPVDIVESEDALTILVALPGCEPDAISVGLDAGVLIVRGQRSLPPELHDGRIHRLEIPHGNFERRIELPPARFALSGRHLANGCLMLKLRKL